MLIAKVKCCGCGAEGDVEIFGLAPKVVPELLFRYVDYHEFTGDMFYLCPNCRRELAVNPMELLGPGIAKGRPRYGSDEQFTPGEHSIREQSGAEVRR